VEITERTATRQIARGALLIMAAFVLSNLVGLVRQVIVLNAFGTSGEMDAFNAANRVSETLFNLVAGGALASAFIPTFTSLLTRGDRQAAWRLASAIANLILLVLAVASLIAALLAPQIVRYLLAPGFSDDPAQEALTVDLLRLMLPAATLFALSGLVMGILNAHQVFFIPALAPAMYQVGMILGVLFFSPRLGIYGLAWGVVLGAGLHLLLQIPFLLRQHAVYAPTLGLGDSNVGEVGRLMLPRLLGVAFVQLNFWINIWLASRLPEGSVTGVTVAFALMLMPQAAIAQSIAIAALPTLAAQFSQGRLADLRGSLVASLRGVLLLAIPASLGLILLRVPLITLLYQRGEFTEHSTALVAWALLWYAAGLVGHSVVEVLARAFYAMHDTKTPVLIGVAAMSLNMVLSVAFSVLFNRLGWAPHGGLALANSLATALEMLGLLLIMHRRLNGLQGRSLFRAAWQGGVAAAAMSFVLWGWLEISAGQPAWQVTLGGLTIGAGVYGAIILAAGVPEGRRALAALRRRVG
jgi:putative peptidoglycan lipid II flippase